MWADFKKTNETKTKVFYDYEFESHELTGKIEYDKKTEKINITKLSEKDDADNANIFTKQ